MIIVSGEPEDKTSNTATRPVSAGTPRTVSGSLAQLRCRFANLPPARFDSVVFPGACLISEALNPSRPPVATGWRLVVTPVFSFAQVSPGHGWRRRSCSGCTATPPSWSASPRPSRRRSSGSSGEPGRSAGKRSASVNDFPPFKSSPLRCSTFERPRAWSWLCQRLLCLRACAAAPARSRSPCATHFKVSEKLPARHLEPISYCLCRKSPCSRSEPLTKSPPLWNYG